MENNSTDLSEQLKSLLESMLNEVLDEKYPEIKNISENEKKDRDKLNRLYNWYEQQINHQLKISDECSGDYRTRSFKVYDSVVEKFLKFCDTPECSRYTKRDLLSQALLEFINKYSIDNR